MTIYCYRATPRTCFLSDFEEDIIETVQWYIDRFERKEKAHSLVAQEKGKIPSGENVTLILGYSEDYSPPEEIEIRRGLKVRVHQNARSHLERIAAGKVDDFNRGSLYKITAPYHPPPEAKFYVPLDVIMNLKKWINSSETEDTRREKVKV